MRGPDGDERRERERETDIPRSQTYATLSLSIERDRSLSSGCARAALVSRLARPINKPITK